MAKKNFYAVKAGYKPGIYATWDECQLQIKGYPGASYKGFASYEDACAFLGDSNAETAEHKQDVSDGIGETSADAGIKGKCYAVKNGRKPGIYATWEECQSQIKGYPNAEYRKCSNAKDAGIYLGLIEGNRDEWSGTEAVAYTNGSWNDSTGEYGYGVVIFHNGKETELHGKGCDPNMLPMKNIAGEMLGAQEAMEYCIQHGIKSLCIKYNYEGIRGWCMGDYKATKSATAAYRNYCLGIMDKLEVTFEKK